jgi:hypothetical protein
MTSFYPQKKTIMGDEKKIDCMSIAKYAQFYLLKVQILMSNKLYEFCLVWFVVFNATFNSITVIS